MHTCTQDTHTCMHPCAHADQNRQKPQRSEIISSTEGLILLPILANQDESLLVKNGHVQLGALQKLGLSIQAAQ